MPPALARRKPRTRRSGSSTSCSLRSLELPRDEDAADTRRQLGRLSEHAAGNIPHQFVSAGFQGAARRAVIWVSGWRLRRPGSCRRSALSATLAMAWWRQPPRSAHGQHSCWSPAPGPEITNSTPLWAPRARGFQRPLRLGPLRPLGNDLPNSRVARVESNRIPREDPSATRQHRRLRAGTPNGFTLIGT